MSRELVRNIWRLEHRSTCYRHLLPGLYSEVAWDKERKGAFRSGNTISRRINNEVD